MQWVQRKSNETEMERKRKAAKLNGVLCSCRVIRTRSLAQVFTKCVSERDRIAQLQRDGDSLEQEWNLTAVFCTIARYKRS